MNKIIEFKIDEDLCKEIEKLRVKIMSSKTLFDSIVNNKYGTFNNVNILEFMDDYTNTNIVYNMIINKLIKDNVTDQDIVDKIVSGCNKYCVNFDYIRNAIFIIDKQSECIMKGD